MNPKDTRLYPTREQPSHPTSPTPNAPTTVPARQARHPTMCEAKLYRSPDCKHTWQEIVARCGPGMGFATCPLFTGHGAVAGRPRITLARGAADCPWHGRRGLYCLNTTRMVTRIRHGVKIGPASQRAAPGFEIPCVVM